jgi:single-strand DNA-binding protein
LIEGRLKLDRWEKDGQKHSKLKVIGERLQMLGGREGGQRGGSRSSGSDQSQYDESEQYTPAGGPPPNDDIPF